MKGFLFVFILVLCLAQSGFSTRAPQFPGNNHFRYVIQLNNPNPMQVVQTSRWLSYNHFDVAGMNWQRGQVEVITTAQGVQWLTNHGLTGQQILVEVAPDPRYLNPASLTERLRAINQAFPQLTHLEQIGTSIQGRPIWALLVSDTPSPADPKYWEKPTLVFDGQHHAREIMTSEVVTDVADTLLRAAQSNPQAQGLLHRWNVWIIPMINVDGTNIVFTQDNNWRKNAHADNNNVFGVDINRNYPYRWAGCRGSSNSKGSQDYHGTGGASEPETQAIVNFAEKIRPTASLSYHSFSELVLYPYGCGGDLTPERVLVEKVGKELAARLPSDSGRGTYTPGTPWQILYDVDGDSMSFFYASYGTLSYTFEINQSFQPNYELRAPTLAKQRNAWGYFLNRIDQNLLHVVVVDKTSGKPAPALIAIDTIKGTKGELPYKTNKAGHYFKVLDPGKYMVSAKLGDGRVGQIEVVMKGAPQTMALEIP